MYFAKLITKKKVYIDCSVADLPKGALISKILKNPHFGSISAPATVVDMRGKILIWYLPNLLSLDQQVNRLCKMLLAHV